MQVDPSRSRVDRSWSQRLKLKYDELLSNFAFNFNLRRYTQVRRYSLTPVDPGLTALGFRA